MCRSDIPNRSDYTRSIYELMCCDDVWLPTIKVRNVIGSLEERDQGEMIILDSEDNVGWFVELEGTFFSPFHFAEFPFDSQQLDIHFTHSAGSLTQVANFVPSASSSRWFQRGEGDAAPGWDLRDIHIEAYNVSLVESISYFVSKYGVVSNELERLPIAAGNNDGGFRLRLPRRTCQGG